MRLGAIVLAHAFPDLLAALLARLRHPAVRLYLHIDAASRLSAFRGPLGYQNVSDVFLLPRFRSRWGGAEVVDAELAGLRQGLADGCDYFVLLSGQDCLLWPTEEILAFFKEAHDKSYIAGFPLPDDRWQYGGRIRTDFYTFTVRGRRETCIPAGVPSTLSWRGRLLNGLLRLRTALMPTRRFPAYLRPFGGSQWWNLSRSAATFVLDFTLRHPEYRRYHEHTLLPDEVFFQSILMGTPFSEQHEIVNDALRFMVWPSDSSHPRGLTISDVPAMIASGMPVARKLHLPEAWAILASLRPTSPARGRSLP
jgi:hypothetical protein